MKKKIFVSEDDEFYAKILTTKFNLDDFEVKVVPNGEKLLQLLDNELPNLIVIDLMTPVMDGFETLEKLNETERYKEIPKVVLSNLSQEEDIKKTRSLGALAHLVKSEKSIHELVNKMKTYIKADTQNETFTAAKNSNEQHEETEIIKSSDIPEVNLAIANEKNIVKTDDKVKDQTEPPSGPEFEFETGQDPDSDQKNDNELKILKTSELHK